MYEETFEQNEHEQNDLEQSNEEREILCENCRSPKIEEGYRYPLCIECRDQLAKRPVPLWVKGFLVLLFAIFLIGLTQFSKGLEGGVAFERGLRAEADYQYKTAIKHYESALEEYPDSTLILSRLGIAYYYYGRIGDSINTINLLMGREYKDDVLLEQVNDVIDKIDSYYFPGETLNIVFERFEDRDEEIQIRELLKYLDNYPNDRLATYSLANLYYYGGNYDEAEKYITRIVEVDPRFHDGYLFLAAIYRERGNYVRAMEYSRLFQAQNIESPAAYVAMTRIKLKNREDEEALNLAMKAYELEPDNAYVISNLSMAYHYNGIIKERDEMLHRLYKFEWDLVKEEINTLTSIIDGTLQWR